MDLCNLDNPACISEGFRMIRENSRDEWFHLLFVWSQQRWNSNLIPKPGNQMLVCDIQLGGETTAVLPG